MQTLAMKTPAMRHRRRWFWRLAGVLALTLLAACVPSSGLPTPLQPATPMPQSAGPLRLFIVSGEDVSEIWAGQIRTGIVETLAREGDYRIGETLTLGEYRLQLDAGTADSGAEYSASVAEVIALIQDFDADVVITVGSQATVQVILAYPDPEQRFVFCGFSGNVLSSGLSRPNVTGVLEIPYPVQTARLAVHLVPDSLKFMVLGDRSSTDAVATESIFDTLLKDPPYPAQPTLRQTDDWAEWQAFVTEAGAMDFVILGKYDHVRDASGMLIPQTEVLRWTLLHSEAPVFGLWRDTVSGGAVGGLVLSGEEQGVAAAQLALQIVRGIDPALLLPVRPGRNTLAINLAAANHWQLLASFELLVTASFGGVFPTP